MSQDPATPKPASVPSSRFRISRLVLKELRETLRDRRTIITLILMPLLVYPALSLVFKSFLLSKADQFISNEPIKFAFVYGGDGTEQQTRGFLSQFGNLVSQLDREDAARKSAEAVAEDSPNASTDEKKKLPLRLAPTFAEFGEHGWAFDEGRSKEDLKDFVEQGLVQLAVEFNTKNNQRGQFGTIRILGSSDPLSKLAKDYLESKINRINEFEVERRLTLAKLPTVDAISLQADTIDEEEADAGPGAFPLASIVPLILVLMTITGAVYPAIDLTAGERERGTLETLMAAPIPRFSILFAKFLAVLTVAMLTATLNIIGMFATVWAFQLDKEFGGGAFGFSVMIQMLLLLVLFAAFFSALLLVVTSFAKSFKEAQVYLIPVILLSMGPGLMALDPSMELAGANSIFPMINILLLARDVINGSVEIMPAITAVVSTLLYSLAAIGLAARFFGSDAILYADSSSWAEMLQRPRKANQVVPFGASMLCLVLLLPVNFASVAVLTRMPSEGAVDLQVRFLAMGLFLFISFWLIPTLVALHRRTNLSTGFGLQRPRAIFLIAGVLLGVSLWPIVMSMTELWQQVYGFVAGAEAQAEWKEKLVETTAPYVEMIRQVPPWVIALSFSLIPAFCEEWFFRGMLMKTFLKEMSGWKAIALTAVLFGGFHMISNSVIAIDRFIPTTMVGFVLGYLAYKSNSIWPSVILHSLHNAFVVFLAYYQKQLVAQPWFPGEDDPIPYSWVAIGVGCALLALTLIALAKRDEPEIAN